MSRSTPYAFIIILDNRPTSPIYYIQYIQCYKLSDSVNRISNSFLAYWLFFRWHDQNDHHAYLLINLCPRPYVQILPLNPQIMQS